MSTGLSATLTCLTPTLIFIVLNQGQGVLKFLEVMASYGFVAVTDIAEKILPIFVLFEARTLEVAVTLTKGEEGPTVVCLYERHVSLVIVGREGGLHLLCPRPS